MKRGADASAVLNVKYRLQINRYIPVKPCQRPATRFKVMALEEVEVKDERM